MSASRDRVRRVYAATRELLDDLHPGTGEQWIWRFRRRFIAPASIFESGAHVLENMDMHKSDALLLSLDPRRRTLHAAGALWPRAAARIRIGKAGEYLKALFLGRSFEHFYMLALDASGRLARAASFCSAAPRTARPFTCAMCWAKWCARTRRPSSSATTTPTTRCCPRATTSAARSPCIIRPAAAGRAAA